MLAAFCTHMRACGPLLYAIPLLLCQLDRPLRASLAGERFLHWRRKMPV